MSNGRVLVHDPLLSKPAHCFAKQKADQKADTVANSRHKKCDVLSMTTCDSGCVMLHFQPIQLPYDAKENPWPNQHESGEEKPSDEIDVMPLLIPLYDLVWDPHRQRHDGHDCNACPRWLQRCFKNQWTGAAAAEIVIITRTAQYPGRSPHISCPQQIHALGPAVRSQGHLQRVPGISAQ